jgi:ferric-dicitrate binding protein FerR (iron transport regulator)
VAQHGSRTRTILPDGSTVFLNAGSSIFYDKHFNGTLREVTLLGEAFFDVVKNPDRPFIVHAGGINIRVLGTSFNVRSYPDEKIFETTLIHGLVQISKANDAKHRTFFLHPNQKFMASYFDSSTDEDEDENDATERATSLDSKSFAIKNLDSTLKEADRLETAWVYNRLEFRGDDFEALAKKLERWYNISIHFEDEAVKELQFNGSLEKETMQQAFAALQIAVPFKYTIKGNEIFIRTSQ